MADTIPTVNPADESLLKTYPRMTGSDKAGRIIVQKAANDPTEDATKLGPMARVELRDGLHEQVEESIRKSAKILVGGEVPDRPGAWYPATVLAEVQPGQPAHDDELFGPVASIIKARNEEGAMRIANDSRFGLGGSIYSKDEKMARELAVRHFDTGIVSVNGYNVAITHMPFGDVKDSGYGREHARLRDEGVRQHQVRLSGLTPRGTE